MIKRRRAAASMSQRKLERLTGIDQSVISRLENGKQYGLRWSRFARLVGVLDGLDEPARAPTPWWVEMGIIPPDYMLESLRAKGLIPADPLVDALDADPEEIGDAR
jgi:transcriptional regulator with XRE-family HTH domain